mmetsp:Transcript_110588/g.253233  ORF Transcript_110588/g.253233 Transcript_110588/m.253233 type:complete len:391 (-) Transcript_110588:15-1187(-)
MALRHLLSLYTDVAMFNTAALGSFFIVIPPAVLVVLGFPRKCVAMVCIPAWIIGGYLISFDDIKFLVLCKFKALGEAESSRLCNVELNDHNLRVDMFLFSQAAPSVFAWATSIPVTEDLKQKFKSTCIYVYEALHVCRSRASGVTTSVASLKTVGKMLSFTSARFLGAICSAVLSCGCVSLWFWLCFYSVLLIQLPFSILCKTSFWEMYMERLPPYQGIQFVFSGYLDTSSEVGKHLGGDSDSTGPLLMHTINILWWIGMRKYNGTVLATCTLAALMVAQAKLGPACTIVVALITIPSAMYQMPVTTMLVMLWQCGVLIMGVSACVLMLSAPEAVLAAMAMCSETMSREAGQFRKALLAMFSCWCMAGMHKRPRESPTFSSVQQEDSDGP